MSDTQTLRRIAERGLKYAQDNKDSHYVDLFQHLLDELARVNILSVDTKPII